MNVGNQALGAVSRRLGERCQQNRLGCADALDKVSRVRVPPA
jgi:hypothetical protein